MLDKDIIRKLKNGLKDSTDKRGSLELFYKYLYGALEVGEIIYVFSSRCNSIKEIEYLGKVGEGSNTYLVTRPLGSTHSSLVQVNYKLESNFHRTIDYYDSCDDFAFSCREEAQRFFKKLKKKEAQKIVEKAQKVIEHYNNNQTN